MPCDATYDVVHHLVEPSNVAHHMIEPFVAACHVTKPSDVACHAVRTLRCHATWHVDVVSILNGFKLIPKISKMCQKVFEIF